MPKGESLESFLEKAEDREKEHAWLEAVEFYERALHIVGKNDSLRKGEIQERVGHCFNRGAFQAENQEEFKKHMRLSVKAYGEAAELFERLGDSKKQARKLRNQACMELAGAEDLRSQSLGNGD